MAKKRQANTMMQRRTGWSRSGKTLFACDGTETLWISHAFHPFSYLHDSNEKQAERSESHASESKFFAPYLQG
ncbi:hypothetical protein KIN20_002199 [Parelaphostrongylus tenuis]|uniref:Uncharacterized protein n=1 Tax=Parelaphostrongylus tenuis TaxID=148309 RepID=A0AAD5MDV5_PARTN|nr:hypothetical protein KIN20_002199 [Parelaphostrongylus tenuis]